MSDIAILLRERRKMVKASRRRPVKPQAYPRAALVYYSKVLLDRQRLLGQLLREVLFPELENLIAQAAIDESGGYRRDSVSEDIIRVFGVLRATFAAAYPPERTELEATQAAATNNTHSKESHQKQVKAAVGIDVIVPEPGVSVALQGFIAENMDLVASLEGDALTRFQTIVRQGISQGLRVGDIRDQLMHQLGISKSRAQFLAVDQTNKLFGKLTKLRQESVGVTEYTWSTSKDERVRPRHQELEGTRQVWKKPPIVDPKTGRRAHPGGDYRCRCQALPVFPADLLGTPEPEP